MPALAPHESSERRPSAARNGSTSEQHDHRVREHAHASTPGRPASVASSAIAAIADARSTDGSKRVIAAKTTTIAERERGPAAERQPAQQRAGEREHERDVLARDREQVRQAGVAVVVDDSVGDATRVAEQEAGDAARASSASSGRVPRRTTVAQRVRRPRAGRAAARAADDLRVVEPADRVAPAGPVVERARSAAARAGP